MADITWADVVAVAPELNGVDTDAQTDILALVNEEMDPEQWGGDGTPRYRLARIYLAAHHGSVSLQNSTGVAGPVVSEKVGDLSRQWAAPPTASQNIETTPYGRLYASLLKTAPARGPVVL